MVLKRHSGFDDADVNGVQLGSDGTNLQKDAQKVLDDANARFADIQDVNIPTDIGLSENGKLIAALYEPPATYGDESDGALTATSTKQQVNTYTDLTADLLQGSTVVYVRDTTGFSAGDEVMLHHTQNRRDPALTNRMHYEFARVLSVDSGVQLTLTAGVTRSYLSDSDGNKQHNTKTQLIRVPNFSTVTINSPNSLGAKPWDGYSGGLLVFRCTALTGDGDLDLRAAGFRAAVASSGPSIGEGWEGLGYLDGPYPYNVENRGGGQSYNQNTGGGQSRGAGGHNGAGEVSIGYLGHPAQGGVDYGLTDEDMRTYLTLGGAGSDTGGSPTPGRAAGSMIVYAQAIGTYTGSLQARGEVINSNVGSAGGSLVLLSETNFTGTYDNLGGQDAVSGADGYALFGQPSTQARREYVLGAKVSGDYQSALPGDLLTKTAIDDLVKASNDAFAVSINDVIATNTGQQALFTVPAGKAFVIDSVEVVNQASTDDGAQAFIQFGVSVDPDSILAPVQLSSSLVAPGDRENWSEAVLLSSVLFAGDILQFGVTTASTNTSQLLAVIVRGALIDF